MVLLVPTVSPAAFASSGNSNTGCTIAWKLPSGDYSLGNTIYAYFTITPASSCSGSGHWTFSNGNDGGWSCSSSSPCDPKLFFSEKLTSSGFYVLYASFSGPKGVSSDAVSYIYVT